MLRFDNFDNFSELKIEKVQFLLRAQPKFFAFAFLTFEVI